MTMQNLSGCEEQRWQSQNREKVKEKHREFAPFGGIWGEVMSGRFNHSMHGLTASAVAGIEA